MTNARFLLLVATATACLGAFPVGRLSAQQALVGPVQEIRRSSAAGDHSRAIAMADSLVARFPNHPNVVLVRTVAVARSGNLREALRGVQQLQRWDPRYVPIALRDSSLAPLSGQLNRARIDSLVEARNRQVSRARVWATIAEPDLVPEGTAWDPITRSVLIGSLNRSKILAIASDGGVTERVRTGAAGIGSVAGIHVDAARRRLWVTSNARFDDPADSTASFLYAFDAATGVYVTRYQLSGGGPRFLNDITTGQDGTVYVTDSNSGRVYTLTPNGRWLEEYAPLSGLVSPNGITMSSDGRHLFVADMGDVHVADIGSGERWTLALPDSIHLSGGIDGLAFVNNTLIAHHPLAFWRVARYGLDPRRRAIVSAELIEANTPDGRTSTTGEIVDNDYVFIGNSQIDRMNAKTIDAATMEPVRIYRVRLTPR
jgi:sugar lactone lactonase YvrE